MAEYNGNVFLFADAVKQRRCFCVHACVCGCVSMLRVSCGFVHLYVCGFVCCLCVSVIVRHCVFVSLRHGLAAFLARCVPSSLCTCLYCAVTALHDLMQVSAQLAERGRLTRAYEKKCTLQMPALFRACRHQRDRAHFQGFTRVIIGVGSLVDALERSTRIPLRSSRSASLLSTWVGMATSHRIGTHRVRRCDSLVALAQRVTGARNCENMFV